MAIIDGKQPSADAVDAAVRVVIKLTSRGPGNERGVQPNKDANVLASLRRVAPDAEFKTYFSEQEQLRAALSPPFNRYLSVEVRDRKSAAAFVRRLQALPEIEEVYVEGGPTPPPTVNPDDDPRSANQGYLGPAPAGIDARWAWSLTSGAGVGFVDLEQGWTLNHEDLAAAGITLISGLNRDYAGHGTSVLGEVAAVDNQRGGVGIAPDTTARVVSQWRTSTNYNTAAAILSAEQAMSAGDVLLLEAQTTFNSMSNLPVEVETAVFDAIRHATDAGIVIIEAAGNGSRDLDTFVDNANRNVLDRASADFRDSGAIMVGAASSTLPHVRLGYSNFGSRIDCYGWGENIDTTGDGWKGTSTTTYTPTFSGTSGASPIVAGAAVLIQAWRKRPGGGSYTPGILRDILSSPTLNTASANPATDKIGVMPNVRAIIEAQIANDRFRVAHGNCVSLVYILFGLVNAAPGVIWLPVKGPVPVAQPARCHSVILAHPPESGGASAWKRQRQSQTDTLFPLQAREFNMTAYEKLVPFNRRKQIFLPGAVRAFRDT